MAYLGPRLTRQIDECKITLLQPVQLVSYLIDFSEMKQTNQLTLFQRNIQFIRVDQDIIFIKFENQLNSIKEQIANRVSKGRGSLHR